MARERSIIFQIHELKSKKTWLEAYRNPYLHFVDPWAEGAVYTDRQTHRQADTQKAQADTNLPGSLRIPRLRMRTEA